MRRGATVLVCQRPAHKRHGGLFEFPGGKLLPGESTGAALARELDEELGLRVTAVGVVRFTARDPGAPYVIDFVEVTVAGEPVPTEHTAVVWADAAALAHLPLAPGDRRFVDEVLGAGRAAGGP